jgi:hypothetical protein
MLTVESGIVEAEKFKAEAVMNADPEADDVISGIVRNCWPGDMDSVFCVETMSVLDEASTTCTKEDAGAGLPCLSSSETVRAA